MFKLHLSQSLTLITPNLRMLLKMATSTMAKTVFRPATGTNMCLIAQLNHLLQLYKTLICTSKGGIALKTKKTKKTDLFKRTQIGCLKSYVKSPEGRVLGSLL